MSSVDDEPIDFDDDIGANGFCLENPPFDENCDMKGDCDNDKGGDYEVKFEHHQGYDGGPMRQMRPMRPQFRPMSGPRPPFQCNFRGPPRGLPPGPGGMRGFPYMRPGMAPNPSGPPFDFNGPPPMGMPRNCGPPRFPPGPPRFPQMNEPIKEEDNNEAAQNYEMNRGNSDYELAPPNSNAFPNYPPGIRSHGPPPFMNGPPGGMPSGPPLNNQGYQGPAPGSPFAPPPGVSFSGPPASAQQGTPYSAPMFTSNNAPPFNNVPTSCPPFGGPPGQNFAPNQSFNSPHASFNGPFGGPPGYPPGGQHFPPQSNLDTTMSGPPPPHATSVPLVVAPGPPACPQPAILHGSQPIEPSGPLPNDPRFAPPTEMPHFSPPITNGAPACHQLENPPVPVPNPSIMPVASVPPINMPPAPSVNNAAPFPTALPPSMAGMHPLMPHMMNGPPRCEMPPMSTVHPGFPPMPMHMMPPPMSSIIPPFRPTMPPMVLGNTTVRPMSDDIWVENFTAEGKPYYYNMRTRETRWDRPENVTVVRQGEVESSHSLPAQNTTDSNVPYAKAHKPPEVAVWGEYKNPEGKSYYHNSKTSETTWEKPKILLDYEGTQKQVQSGTNTKTEQPHVNTALVTQNKPPTSISEPVQQSISKVESFKSIEMAIINKGETKSTAEPRKDDDGDDKGVPVKSKDTSRPVSSTAVPGTPWCVVWTGDDRAFYFNPSQRLSVWERPEDLKGRVDVDRLLEKPVVSNAILDATPSQIANADDAADGASVAKKVKLETEEVRPGAMDTGEATVSTTEEKEQDKSNQGQDKIAVGMEAAKEAEERAARERAVQPLEIRIRRFREMLVEMQVSAFSTWEKELHKIVFDPRYLLLTSKERKQTFEAYVKERADEERKEKKNKLKECRDKFNELLEEARLTTKSTFTELSTKYAKDDRFRAIEKNRDRESMFQDFLSELRKKEKEDKNRDKEKVRTDFLTLLKEQSQITRHSHWADIKRRIDTDPRYKAVESSSRREDLFRECAKKIPDIPVAVDESSNRKEKDKRERRESSHKVREKDSSIRDRAQYSQKDKEGSYRAILSDLIRDASITWREAKKILRRDERWDSVADVLERSEREEIFKEYITTLAKRS